MPFPRLVGPTSAPPPHHEGCVDEAFFFVKHAAFAQFVGNVHENATQNFTAAPRLKAEMNRFVVRIASN